MKLRHKITLTIISSSVLLALVLISLFTLWSKYELEKKMAESFVVKNAQVSRQVDQFIRMRLAEVNYISKFAQSHYEKNLITEIENDFFEFRNELKVFQNLQLFTIEGKKIVDTNRIGINQIYKNDNFIHAENEDIYIHYQYDTETKSNVISLNKVLLNKNGIPEALLVANIPQMALTNLIRSLVVSDDTFSSQDLELIKDDGSLLYSNFRKNKKDTDLLSVIEDRLKDKNFESYQDDNNFYAISRSFHTDFSNQSKWYMIIKQNKKDAFKSIQERAIVLGLITMAIIFISFIFSYQVAVAMTSPIEEASKALSQAGDGDFSPIFKVKVSNDEFGELVHSLQDMSQKIDMLIKEHAIKYRMAALGKMAGSIAHEINNPLHLINNHAIILNKTLMRQNYSIENDIDKERIKRSLRSITDTVHRISQIISGMKSLSRDGGNDPFEVIKISNIIEGTLTLCYESLKSKEIELKIKKPDADFSIECRNVQIQQVLLNLINNAADAIKMQDEKWIELSIYELNGNINFEISNSGPRISDEIGANIFTPFYTTKSEGQGTGLGLSISKTIITSHGGNIKLDLSKKHTTFIASIPISHQNENGNEQEYKQAA